MKKLSLTFIFAMSFLMAFANADLPSVRGVWANDNAEAIITDSVCIYFAKIDSITMQATLEIPTAGYIHKTTFTKDGTVASTLLHEPLEIKTSDGKLDIGGNTLTKVEDIETVEPYDMPLCNNKYNVGKCLQEWRLGLSCGVVDDMPYCEINTNRHMFVYMVNKSMVYIRAAATRNNNNGTLFFQNIRMMKNKNTGEYTMSIIPDNFNVARHNLEIDDTKFNPNACTFNPDGGIYWSLISFTPDMILLNGCGETYKVPRPTKESPLNEWIKYQPY